MPSTLTGDRCTICGCEMWLLFRKWGFNIVHCGHCGLGCVNPRAARGEPLLSTIEKDSKLDAGIAAPYGEIVYNLNHRVAPGRLLQVGCVTGHFMQFARQYGWEVEGIASSREASRQATERFGLKLHPFRVLQDRKLDEGGYDCCVLVDTIEYLPDARATLMEMWRLLRAGGLIYITTPNFASYRSLLLREQWSRIIPIGQVSYFDGGSLGLLLASAGFTNVENLTPCADLGAELRFAEASGGLRVPTDELAAIRELPGTGRAEQLVMCARKPADSTAEIPGEQAHAPAVKTSWEGRLVRRPGDTIADHKVYFVEHGCKRWVTDARWIVERGMAWPGDLHFISAEELEALLPGPPLP